MSLFVRTDEPLDHCLAERLTPLDAPPAAISWTSSPSGCAGWVPSQRKRWAFFKPKGPPEGIAEKIARFRSVGCVLIGVAALYSMPALMRS